MSEKKENLIDVVIGAISPKWAYERAMYRFGLGQVKSYDAARVDRLQPWTPVNATAEQTDSPHRDILRARARDLERNSDIAASAIGAIIRNVVGTGIHPQARIKKANGEFDEKLNRELEQAWKQWAGKTNCDITGQQTFYELQSTFLRRRVVDGEVLAHLVIDRSAEIPLKIQGIEVDLLDTGKQIGQNGNIVASGVEIDAYYKPLAYWLQSASLDGFVTVDSRRISADRILHLFNKWRFTQVRGISELAQVMRRMKETGEYLDAELVAAKIAASFALFVKRQMPGMSVGRLPQDSEGNRVDTIAPGMIEYLNPGEDITTAAPGRNATTAKDFIEIESRMAAAGLGLSYEVLSRDMSQSTYSSARQNHLEDRRTFAPMQQYMITHFCQPVWKEFVTACVLSGVVNIPGFFSDPEKYLETTWIAPGWAWIDPLKDVKASIEEMNAGLNTLADIAAEQGKDWQELLDQRARELEYAKKLGLKPEEKGAGNGGSGTSK